MFLIFIHLIKFCVDNARVFQRVYDRWSSRMPTVVSPYLKHVDLVLRLENRVDCYVWIRPMVLWVNSNKNHM